MKKTLLLLLSILILGWVCRYEVKADTINTVNLLDPTLFSSITYEEPVGGQYAKLETSDTSYISVVAGIEYFFMPTYVNKQVISGSYQWCDLPLFSSAPSIRTYDASKTLIDTNQLTKPLISEGTICGYAFSVPSSVASIQLTNIELISSMYLASDFISFYDNRCGSIDGALLLIEADKIKYLPTASEFDYETIRGDATYDISNLYLGEDLQAYFYGTPYWDDLSPVIGVNQYAYETTVDNPISLSALKETLRLTAYDEIDGNITDSIVASSPTYVSEVAEVVNVKDRSLGTYAVSFSVADQAGNPASITVDLTVCDTVRPTLVLEESIISYSREVDSPALLLSDIQSEINVVDNYSDVVITNTIDGYTGQEHDIGVFAIVYTFADSSGNSIEVTVTIENKDTTAPVIDCGWMEKTVSYTHSGGLQSILDTMEIDILDSYEGKLAYQITQDAYSANARYVGTYTIKILAEDSSGNEAEATFLIHVIDDIDPYFYIDNNVVIVNTGMIYDEEDIIGLLKYRQLTANRPFEIEIIEDNYTEHRHQIGEYEMKIQVRYDNGEEEQQILIFRVEKANPTPPTGFFANLWFQIKKIFRFIWNIIKWPFVKLISLF